MNKTPDTAMVLAAGLGTRMRPLTNDRPKPMIEVAGKPLIDYTLDDFADAGVTRAVVNVHYLADQIEQHVRKRKAPQISISDERDLLLETGGGLRKARALLGDAPFFCANTDAILDASTVNPCQALAQHWDCAEMDALLLLCPMDKTSGYDGRGDFSRNDDGRIAFRGDAPSVPYVFTGLQIISPSLVDEGPDGPFSTKVLWENAAARGRLFGAVYSGFWMHVGDAEGLAAAEQRLSLRN